jgi:hypothetical protein
VDFKDRKKLLANAITGEVMVKARSPAAETNIGFTGNPAQKKFKTLIYFLQKNFNYIVWETNVNKGIFMEERALIGLEAGGPNPNQMGEIFGP